MITRKINGLDIHEATKKYPKRKKEKVEIAIASKFLPLQDVH